MVQFCSARGRLVDDPAGLSQQNQEKFHPRHSTDYLTPAPYNKEAK